MATTSFAILPEDIIQTLSAQLDGTGTQFLSLPHPRTGLLALFLPSSDKILEVQAVSPPNGRSWFLGEEVVEDGKLVMMTPIDPTFLLLPLLQAGHSDMFRTADDLLEEIVKSIVASSETKERALLEKSMTVLFALPYIQLSLCHICDVNEFGPETTVYRYSSEKAKQYLRRKISRLENSTTLDKSRTIVRNLAKDGLMEDGNEKLLALGRTKAAFDLVSQYLSPELKQMLLSSYDFAELDAYLIKELAPLKSATNTSGKGNKTDEKKRKAVKGSHGVEQLKKANTTGMAKLSSFFNKVKS